MNGPIPAPLRPMPILQGLLCALALGSAASQGAIEIDPGASASQQPQLLQSASGAPLVNIQTPSRAGVSHNRYQRFDIDPRGVILNNARTNANTRLGGWIQGNPNLASGSARVILNEINSSDPSRLNGFAEVAGTSAELVIANPAGIRCDGCGFINASRATLSTGTPILQQGRLEGYRVESGEIAIEGAGMDARGSDYAQLISRAVRLNAGIWANDLGITTGSNRVATGGQPMAPINGQQPPPRFAIDVASLGGMYAGQIQLIGSEAGLGVNNGGHIDAVEQLTLDIHGQLDNPGWMTCKGSLSIRARELDNPGEIAASGAATLQASGSLDNSGSISSEGQLTLSTDQLQNRTGARISAPQLELQAHNLENRAEARIQGQTLHLHGDGRLSNRGRIDGNDTRLEQAQIDNLGTGRLSGGRLTIQADTLNQHQEAGQAPLIGAREQLDLSVAQLDNGEQSQLFSAGDLRINAQTIRNQGGAIEALGALQITAQRLENLNAGLTVRQVDDPTAYQELIQPSGDTNRYPIEDCQGIGGAQDGNSCSGRNGSFEDYTWLRLTLSPSHTELVSSRPGRILADGDIRLQGGTLINQDSQILSAATLEVAASDLQNLTTQGQDITGYNGTAQFTWVGWCGGFFSKHHCRQWGGVTPYQPAPELGTPYDLPTTRLSGQSPPDHQQPSLATTAPAGPLPDSALFQTRPDSTASYLVESDPAFADYRNWLSSDYMLQQLGLDPQQMLKRLGDGFYEQRLLQQQLQERRGTRLLASYRSGEEQFRALMEAGIVFANQWELVPGVRLSAEQMAALTHDIVWLEQQTVELADGSHRQVLAPRLYLRPGEGDLQSDGGLLRGREVEIDLGDAGRLVNSATLAADDLLRLNAGRIDNPGGTLRARRLSLLASESITSSGTMQADELLQLESEGDLTLDSVIGESRGADGERRSLRRQAALYLSDDAARLIARAEGNLTLNAARIDNPGSQSSTQLEAGGDLTLGTRNTGESEAITWDSDNRLGRSRWSDQGSKLQTGGDIRLQAGNDINARGAIIESRQGALTLDAGNDIRLFSGVETRHWEEARKLTSRDLLSSTTRIARHRSDDTLALGSSLGSRKLQIQSGGDTHIEGSQLVADQTVSIHSEGALQLQAAEQRHQESHYSEKRKSGLFSSGGLSLTLGRQQMVQSSELNEQTLSASTLGSTESDLQLRSDHHYQQRASDLLAPGGDIRISAPSIEILSGTETRDLQQQMRFSQSGITSSISNPVINAAQTLQRLAAASRQTDNPRMKLLAAATAGLAINEAYDAVRAGQGETINGKANQVPTGRQDKDGKAQTRDARWDERVGGIDLSLSLGSSRNQSERSNHQETIHGSRLAAGGEITLSAEDPLDGDITIHGSDLEASGDLTLDARHAITVEAATAESSERSHNRSKSASLGVSFGTSGFAMTASASQGKGDGNNDETTHRNSHLESGNTARLTSGDNTRIRGAVIQGSGIVLNSSGDLTLESLQDSQDYRYRQKSSGANLRYGTSLSGGINLDRTQVDGQYRSVVEQSGLHAGDNGFQVNVEGDTTLKGAVIGSNRAASDLELNRLTTKTLSTASLFNASSASAKSRGLSVSSQMFTQGRLGIGKGVVANTLSNDERRGGAAATTASAISEAAITITDPQEQVERTGYTDRQTLVNLERQAEITHRPVSPQDVESLRKTVDAEHLIRSDAFGQISKAITDVVYRSDNGPKKIILTKVCSNGNPGCLEKTAIDPRNHNFVYTEDGTIYVFNNGIFNNEDEAIENAIRQHGNKALETGIYTVINPITDNAVAEVVYSGLDKIREVTSWTWLLGFSNAAQSNLDLRAAVEEHNRKASKTGGVILKISESDHSRGSLTSSIATQIEVRDGKTNIPIGKVLFNGAAANAQRMANYLYRATGGDGKIYQSTHVSDLVGTLVGGNQPTGGNSVGFRDAHSSYGPGVDFDDRVQMWGSPIGSNAKQVHPNQGN